ncbi:MAG: hypothetical protein ISP55_00415 [Flavobacteriales bacterium]|nr:hypothetical protein [Flavobacteriales bacterium]
MNLRTTILRGSLGTFALALFASLQAQTITFTADFYPDEVTSCIVTFNGDTILNVDGALLFPNGPNDVNVYSIATYGAGDYTVSIDDSFGDGGTGMAVDGGAFNCTGQCSGVVAGSGSEFAFTLTSDVPGCTDETALNYDDTATLNDGSCLFDICATSDDEMVFVNMTDTWGDGWNGNTYEIYADGVLIASGTLDDSVTGTGGTAGGANAGQDTICIPSGACYEVVSGGGSFLGEIGWTIVSAYTGAIIAGDEDGGTASFYFGPTAEVCGCTDVTALNFDGDATVDDGSCVFPSCDNPDDVLVQLLMYDTFGDGWDGASYTLSNQAGEILSTGSLDDATFVTDPGAAGYDFLCISSTECYVFEVSGGSFPGEKEWQMVNFNTGEILYDFTANDGFGVFGVAAGDVVCGCTDANAFNYDETATADDGSCFSPSCLGNADSTSYILYLNHDIFLFWGNNAAYIYDPVTGDTLLSAGYNNDLYVPDFEATVVDGYWEFCVPNDACLNFSGGGGSPSGQPLWYILDFSGNVIHEGTLGVYDIGFGSSTETCVSGCTLPAAINYNADATIDDGSCVVCDNGQLGFYLTLQDNFASGWSPGNDYYLVSEETGDTVLTGTMAAGSTTIEAVNCLNIGCYTFSTGAIFTTEGWGLADNLGNVYADLTYGPTDGYPVAFGGTGVTDCAFPGCTDPAANNYNISASVDDGTCEFPPANDNPEDAQAIACELILTGSLANSNGDEYSGTTVLGNAISESGAIWYEFNADQDYQVTFNTCASADADNGVTDTDVIVFAVGTDGSLTAIATNDDSGIAGCGSGTTGSFNSIVSINAEQGDNYLVRVGHYSSFSSQTGIVIEANCAVCPDGFPNNDDVCTLALPLVDGGNYDGSLCCSGPDEDFGMPSLSTFATAYGVWYEVSTEAPYNLYNITVDATGDGAVGYATYNGACDDLADMVSGVVSGAVQEEMNQYFAAEQEGPATVSISSPNYDNTYYLFIWTTQTEDCGTYSVSLSAEIQGCTDPTASNYNDQATINAGCLYVGVTQPNDSCSNAIAIACGGTEMGNTGGATAVGGTNACGGSGSGVWYTLDNGGVEQLVTISTCGSTVNSTLEVFQEVDAPDATLEVNSLNADNYQNISAVIVYNGDTVASIPAGELFPTLFNDFYYSLSGGDYTVYFTNEGSELDGIAAQVISSDGSSQDLLCSGGCTTDPQVCFDLSINTDSFVSETSWTITNANGSVVASGAPSFSNTTNTETLCLPAGSYTLVVADSFGDGIGTTGSDDVNLTTVDGTALVTAGDVTGSSTSFDFTLDASPFNFPAGATVEQSFTIFGGTGTCGSLLCWNEGDNTLISDESCENGETFQFISDDNANTYAILVSAGSGSIGGPFELSVSCEPVVYGCQDELACNYNSEANVDDVNDPCDYTSCLDCDTETWDYCYGLNESWSFTLVNPNGGTIVVDLAGTLIEQGWDELVIDDAATGANLYNSDVDPDDGLVIGTDSLTVSFTSDGSVSCVTSTTGYFISLAITCAPAPSTGCADSTACNYNGPVDFADNTLCDYSCLGCTNPDAVNYNPFASLDDGSCCFGSFITFNMFDSFGDGWNGATYSFYDADGNLLAEGGLLSTEGNGDADSDEICIDASGCVTLVVTGGSFPSEVSWTISGNAFNNTAGGPGTYQVGLGTPCTEGCGLPFAPNYVDPDSVDIVNDDLCDFTAVIMGCTYPDASNYGVYDDGTVIPEDMLPTNDDGSCIFDTANPCPTDLNGDGQTTTSDLLIFLGAFGTDC